MKKNYFTGLLLLVSTITFSQNIPVDFETGGNGANWTWTVFENTTNPALQIVANPDSSGINTSSTVAKFVSLQTGNPWAGCETMHGSDIGTFNITASNAIVRIMVYKTKISDVGIKLVTSSAASLGEIKVANTLINQWEQLTFDFSAHIGGMTYDQLVVFPDFVARAADDTIYFDNVFGQAAFLSTQELSKNDVSIYPNPTNGLVKIKSETFINEIELYNMEGKLLFTERNSSTIDLSSFDNGVYIIRTRQDNNVSNHRVIKN
ncbi:T9SS type A sorting domain-containing protein [Flavobacteriales bacterium]|nr:T9SS type A sorting domain-containing protein [Flavobacteriales bacterium]